MSGQTDDDAKWRRLLIALNDLAESKDHIEAFVAFADTPLYSEAYGALGLEMARRVEGALLSRGLIAYARPFVQSRGGGWTRVPDRFTTSFTKEERQIHNYVLDARKKLIAHSDMEGVFTDRAEAGTGDVVWSVRPAPIVMIPGEADSLDINLASERSRALAKATRDQICEIIEDLAPRSGTTNVILTEPRMFDIDIGICSKLVGMIDKVDDAIRSELGIRRTGSS